MFAARRRQQIKVTECKQASQGRAKESISGEKQSCERQINGQTTQLCNSEENNCLLWLEEDKRVLFFNSALLS